MNKCERKENVGEVTSEKPLARVWRFLRCVLKWLGYAMLWLVALIYWLWCVGAVFLAPFSPWFAVIAGFLLFALPVAAFFLRRWRKWLLYAEIAVFLLISVVFTSIEPTNCAEWISEYRREPKITWSEDGERFTVTDLRDFLFRSTQNFDVAYLSREYKMSDFKGLYYILVHFDNPLGDLVGHSMFGFRFGDDLLVLSVETRRDPRSKFGAIHDLYKQDGLIFILGTASDLLGVRTNARVPREQVHLFKTWADVEDAKIVLHNLTDRLDELRENPEFYNTLVSSCYVELLPLVAPVAEQLPEHSFSYMFNGTSAKMLFRLDILEKKSPDETYEEMEERVLINPYLETWNYARETYLPLILKGE